MNRGSLPRAGGGVAAAGVGLVGAAWAMPEQPHRGEFPGLLLAGAVVMVLSLAVVTVLAVRTRRSDDARRVAQSRRRWSVAASVVAVAVAADAWWETWAELSGGLSTLALPLFAVGATAAVAGGVLLCLASGTPIPVRPVSSVGVVGVAALVAGGTGVALALAVERSPIDATTTVAVDAVSPTGAPREVAWQWETPTGEELLWDEVVPTSNGVAVLVRDGVIALDGRTGEELWRYRVAGAVALQIGASPSGASVMVEFAPGNDRDGPHRLVGFDGATGEIGFDEVRDLEGIFRHFNLALTDHVLLGGSPPNGSLSAYALDDGDLLWEWNLPATCFWRPDQGGYVAAADTVLTTSICGPEEGSSGTADEVVFLALDSSTGEEVWRHSFPLAGQIAGVSAGLPGKVSVLAEPLISPDGATAQLWWAHQAESGAGSVVVDTATGEVLVAEDATPRPVPSELVGRFGLVSEQNGRFTLSPRGGGEPVTARASCDTVVWRNGRVGSWVAVAEGVVYLCVPEDHRAGEPVTISVSPWDPSGQPYQFDAPLGDPGDGLGFEPPYLLNAFPGGIIALADGGTRITAFGT